MGKKNKKVHTIENETSSTDLKLPKDNERKNREIPCSFASPWGNSDVALRCAGNDSLLHANKMTLATFSPVWNALFFSEFAEKNKDIVELDIDYEDMLEILRILHHVNRNFTNEGQKLYTAEKLRSLYREADKYDIPLIRELVKQQLADIKANDAYKISSELNLEKEKNDCLRRMTQNEVRVLLNETDPQFSLPVNDVKLLFLKFRIDGISEPSENEKQNEDGACVNKSHESISRSWTIPKNFDAPWATSDAILRTNDETSRQVHVNKSVLSTFSPFFNAIFFAEDAKHLQDTVNIDVEYDVILEILRVLHHVDKKSGLKNHTLYPPAMISKMYIAAQNLEIDVISEMCKQQLPFTKPSEAFEISVQLGLDDQKSSILKKMDTKKVEAFLKKNGNLSRNVFSPGDVLGIIEKLKKKSRDRAFNCHCQFYDDDDFYD